MNSVSSTGPHAVARDGQSVSPYQNPQLAAWLGSFEGVPDVVAAPPSAPAETANALQRRLQAWLATLGELAPGLGLAFALAMLADAAASWVGVTILGFNHSPVSPILLAVLLGLLIRNLVGLPGVYDPGLRTCVKRILRVGIALLGIRMSLAVVGRVGLVGVPLVAATVTAALVLVDRLSAALGLSRRLGSLIAVGTGICGVSAIVATAPAIDADDDETSYAVATIALFGMAALFLYPFLAHHLFHADPALVGMFLGAAIHDTAQVAGAALSYQQQYDSPQALDAAVIVKLLRNTTMVVVIPWMTWRFLKRRDADDASAESPARTASSDVATLARAAPRWSQVVPLFMIGFLLLALLRTVGDLGEKPFGLLSPQLWDAGVGSLKQLAGWCLVIAMGAIGLNTRLGRLRQLGFKPMAVGFLAAALVGVVAFVVIHALDAAIAI